MSYLNHSSSSDCTLQSTFLQLLGVKDSDVDIIEVGGAISIYRHTLQA